MLVRLNVQWIRGRMRIFWSLFILLFLIPKKSDPYSNKKIVYLTPRIIKLIQYRQTGSFGIHIPTMYTVHGIDISRYQQKINWQKLKAVDEEGVAISFVYIKATEGIDALDPMFSTNWDECKNARLLRGAYHYFKPKKSGKEQAQFFLDKVKHLPGDLPPVIDVEERGKMPLAQFQRNLKSMIDEIEAEVGVKPVIYTSLRFYQDFIKNKFSDYPCWIANYHHPKLLFTKEKWTIWQHSDKGKVSGIIGRVDFNTFNGSMNELKQLCVK
ncbi:glycoside hydrolase family 25 protein [Solitalea sp. MAHUQ-68]|uniref:Glycoside hydrolase family 25 protein n=1 Tax=Solitalea agri TaxID=2953739 RepID=A0A9X2JEA5_9SPHI|nr:GH25 family lysozyme [Solitalea agri]MCO4293755.1 glycoside hydrolase family 25 protein [Solitalea agri]